MAIPKSKDPRFIDREGKVYGRLTVTEYVGVGLWQCSCKCGNITVIRSSNFRYTKSCGCLKRELMAAKNKSTARHGMFGTPEYYSWASMIQRCENPKHTYYNLYGGRGISVCKRWRNDFVAFYTDMGPRVQIALTLDRIYNDGDYEPENCRWASRRQQLRNMRTTHWITHGKRTLSAVEWSEITGIRAQVICYRINIGWSIFDALTIIPHTGNKKPQNRRRIENHGLES